MKAIITILLVIAIVAGVQGTTIRIFNYCGQDMQLYETDNNGGSNSVCNLGANGGSCDRSYGQQSFNLKNGEGGLTLAEFTIDSGGTDYYDVSRIVGYDVGVVIQPPDTNNCAYGVCTNPNCGPPGAYANPGDNSATHGCASGGLFQVFFCAK